MLNLSGPRSLPRSVTALTTRFEGVSAIPILNLGWYTNGGTQALEGKDVKDMLLNVGSGGGAAPAAGAASGGAAAGGAAAAEETKEEEKEEEKEESDEDMGFGLFD